MRILTLVLTALAIAAAVFVIFGQSLRHQRLPEDRLVVWSNPAVTGESTKEALMGHFHDSSRDGWRNAIRPVSTTALRTHFSWFHQIRTGYQRMQIIWMAVTGILLLLLFHATGKSTWEAAAGGLLFAVHPLATGSVLTLAGIAELLALVFLVTGFLILQPVTVRLRESLLRNPAGRGSNVSYARHVAVFGICFLLALWSHELAMAGLPVIVVWMLAVVRSGISRRPDKPLSEFGRGAARLPEDGADVDPRATGRLSRCLVCVPAATAAVIASLAAFLLFIVHRLLVYQMLPEHLKKGHAVLTTTGLSWTERASLGLPAGPIVLEQTFLPMRLGYVHDHLIIDGPGTGGAIAGLVLLGGLLVLVVRGVLRGDARLALWSGWALFFLAGAMGLVADPGDIAPVRLVFMALPGVIGLVLMGVEAVIHRSRVTAVRWVLLAAGLAAFVLLGMRTHTRAAEFEGEDSLVRAQLRDYPKSARAHFDRANLYLVRGQWSAAQAEYEEALALRPEFSMAWVNLGNAYFTQEEYGLAMRAFLFALAETDGRPEFAVVEARAEYHRALILMQQNRNEEAVVALGRMLEIFPDHLPSHANIGFIYANSPDYDVLARYHLTRAMSLETDANRRQALEDRLRFVEDRRRRIGEESPLPPSFDDRWRELEKQP